jgi:hypothetical protein
MDNLDFPKVAKQEIATASNTSTSSSWTKRKYLKELKQRCDDLGVKSGLIMCDHEGDLGDPNNAKRTEAVENHYKWVEAAKFLGCHSIRVNARSSGDPKEQHDHAVDGLRRLSEFGAKHDMNVIVENHGGISSNGEWLAGVIKADRKTAARSPTSATSKSAPPKLRPLQDVAEMMPYAKGVSLKATISTPRRRDEIDYLRMMKIVWTPVTTATSLNMKARPATRRQAYQKRLLNGSVINWLRLTILIWKVGRPSLCPPIGLAIFRDSLGTSQSDFLPIARWTFKSRDKSTA